jgi:hypothetical protein
VKDMGESRRVDQNLHSTKPTTLILCGVRMCLVTERTGTEPLHLCFLFVLLGEAWN